MSRTTRRGESPYPQHPIIQRIDGKTVGTAYVDKETGGIIGRVNVGGKVEHFQIEPRTPQTAKANDRLLTVDVTFGKSYYNNQSGYSIRSTEYWQRTDNVALFDDNGLICRLGADKLPGVTENDELNESGTKSLSTTVNIYLYSVRLDVCFCLRLPALGRRSFLDFRKQYGDKHKIDVVDETTGEVSKMRDMYPTFVWGGMRPPTDAELNAKPGKRMAKHWRLPVFIAAKPATEKLAERADYYGERLDNYRKSHPDHNGGGLEKSAKAVSLGNERRAERKAKDDALLEGINNLPTVEGDTLDINGAGHMAANDTAIDDDLPF